MLESIWKKVIGQRKQEIIMIVMSRAEKRTSFAHQPAVRIQFFRGNFYRCCGIAGQIQMMRRLNISGQWNRAKKRAGKYRRINKCGERDWAKLNSVALRVCIGKCGAELPSGGQFQMSNV